jgi:hypothetical protein
MQERVWTEHLSQRLLDRRGWALFLSTPRGRNWFYKLYRRGQKGRDPAYESWASASWTNPHLDRELIEAEQARLSSESYAEQYCAEFRGEELEPCDVCGGPSPSVSGVVARRAIADGHPSAGATRRIADQCESSPGCVAPSADAGRWTIGRLRRRRSLEIAQNGLASAYGLSPCVRAAHVASPRSPRSKSTR